MNRAAPAAGDTPLRRLAGASVANLGLQGAATGLGLAASLLLSHLLGAEGYGVYAFAFTLATVLSVVTRLGLDSLLMREVAVARTNRDPDELSGVVRWSWRASAAMALGVGAVVTAGAAGVADPRTFHAVALAMALLLPMTLLVVPAATLRGLDRPVVANVPGMLVRPAVFVLGVAGLVLAGIADPLAAIGANLVAHAVALAAFAGPWRRHFPAECRGRSGPVDAGRYLRAAPPLMLLAGLSMLMVQADLLMLKGLASDAAVGIYAVASQLVRLIGMPLAVVNRVVAPRFAASFAADDRPAMQRAAGLTAAGTTALTVPLALGLAGLATPVLGLFGPEFTEGAAALQVLAVGQLVNALCGSVGTVLLMVGRERALGLVSLASAGLNLLLNLLLIPSYGLVGAAIASSASLVLFNVVLVVWVRRTLDLDTTLLGLFRAGGAWRTL